MVNYYGYGGTSTAATTGVWYTNILTNNTSTVSTTSGNTWCGWYTISSLPETEQQARERRLRQEEAQREYEARREEMVTAEARAKTLALHLMPEHVVQDIDVNGGTWVRSARWHDLEYRIPLSHGMVELRHKGRSVGKLCFHAKDVLPRWDEVLARYTLITADEETVWKIANKHSVPSWLEQELVPA